MSSYRKNKLNKKVLAWLLMVNLGVQPILTAVVFAQSVAVPDKNQGLNPNIDQAANGTTVVDIRTPNQHGLSHNQYLDMQVDKSGIIFNNSGAVSQTQLAGYINANPYLAGTHAKVILNEVTGRLPTAINGYLEVAGNQASLILANPNGIVGGNFGFINVDRAVLTTGKPQFASDGSLNSFLVNGGDIEINGSGMDARTAGQTDIIANAVKINAGLWANELNIVTGQNEVNYQTQEVKTIADTNNGISLDVAALGGMYAGRIKMVGTAQGVGVNTAGSIYADNGIELTQTGKVQLHGSVTAKGDINVSSLDELTNTGTVYTQQNLSLKSTAGLKNQGTAKADKELQIQIAGNLQNNGSIEGMKLQIQSADLFNTADLKNLGSSIMKIEAHNITNKGLLASNGGIELTADAYDGSNAEVKAVNGDLHMRTIGDIVLGAQTYSKENTDITAGGNIINTNDLYSEGELTVKAGGGFSNTGNIIAEKDLRLTAQTGNVIQQGTVYGKANAVLTAAGAIDNAGQLLKAEKTLTVSAGTLINNQNGTITADQLTISSSELNNNSGDIKNNGNSILAVTTGDINNIDGNILSNGELSISARNITNTRGIVYANGVLGVQASSFSGDGKILSGKNLSLDLQNDFNNSGEIQAEEELLLTTKGSLTNTGSLLANKKSIVNARDITNSSSGKIAAADISINSGNNFNNTALINGSSVLIKTGVLNNTDTGRIYGDNIHIGAGTLNNTAVAGGTAPVIAARNDIELGVGSFNNKEHAAVSAQGNMHIGGSLAADGKAAGSASVINNNSATIEAGGDLTVNADNINNTNEHFQTEVQIIGTEQIDELQGNGASKRYKYGTDDVYIYNNESDHLHTPEGNYEEWYRYRYTRTIKQDVITSTDPGKILAGGKINIQADTLTNDKSNIVAGGALNVQASNINNIETQGQRIYEDSGTADHYWRHKKHGTDNTGHDAAAYNPANTVNDITVQSTEYKGDTTPVTSGITAGDYIAAPVQKVTIGDSSIITADVSTKIPASSLYMINKDAAAKYIIETDPAFADYKNWISSDYFFEKMQSDPEKTAKRLGDGYYEQQLIKDQILQLTGKRYTGNYASDEQQYQALMDNAVAFAAQSDAQIGVALTKDQIAELDKDIVWMVEKSIILPDGQVIKALVPQVYIKQSKDEQAVGPAVISGADVNFKVTNDLLNRGTVIGKNKVDISADNVNNFNGVIRGSDVTVNAVNDINNIGGAFTADKDMRLGAGRDINIVSSTNTQKNSQGHTTNIAAVGSVSVKDGDLTMSAGRDVNLTAGNIQNQGSGNTAITASRDISLKTVEVSESHDLSWDQDNRRHDDAAVDIGTSIVTKGNLALSAGNDLNARAASVSSEKELDVKAGNNISITSGRASSNVVDDHKHKGKSGGGNSQTTTTHDEQHISDTVSSTFSGGSINISGGKDVSIIGSNVTGDGAVSIEAGGNIDIGSDSQHIDEVHTFNKNKSGMFSSEKTNIYDAGTSDSNAASTISGGTVYLTSGKNTTITASNVVADNDVNITAGGNVNITAAEDTSSSTYKKQVKKSGLLSGGGLGFTIGSEKRKDQYDNQNIEQAGSTVGSISGSVNVEAGKDVNISASDVLAGKDINLTGQNVTIESADNTYNAQEKHEYKKSGLTVSLTTPALSVAESVHDTIKKADSVKDDRLKALIVGKEVSDLTKNGKDSVLNQTKDGLKDGFNADDFSLNISIGSQKSKTESSSSTTIVQGSTVKADGNVNITATEKDINIKGSDVSGEDVSLAAKGDVNITSGKNTNTSSSDSKASSGSIGVSINTSGISDINAGYSKYKGEVKENGTTHTNSTVTASDKLTIASGKDTTIVGGKVSGDSVEMNVGGDLNIESQQDSQKYDEKYTSGGLNVNINYATGVGISGGASSGTTKSDYNSVTDQSGIYAGEGGFDITVDKNTDLKGGVIDSDATPDKNKLTTGTLTWEDVDNKAEYSSKDVGINVNINNGAKDNEKGVTPNIGMPAKGEDESTTKAGVAQGTIEITDKENQKQNIEDLNRDTKNTLNKLEQIFDKQTVAERKEMAALFGELAYNVVHNIDGTPEQKAAMHALVGGIMGELTGSGFLAGASGAAVNKLLSDELKKIAGDDPALHQWLSAALGAVVSDVVAGNAQAGSSTAASGTKNNDLMLTPEELSELVFDNDRAEEYCKQQGIPVTQENIEKLKTGFTNFAKENSESDAVIATGGFGVEGSYIYDLKAQESYLAAGGSGGKGGIGAALSLVAIKIVSSDSSIDLNDAKVRKDILSGTSIGANFYVGVGGGISIPLNSKYSGRITIIVKGIGTPQVGISGSNAQAGSDIANDRYNEALDNKYGSD